MSLHFSLMQHIPNEFKTVCFVFILGVVLFRHYRSTMRVLIQVGCRGLSMSFLRSQFSGVTITSLRNRCHGHMDGLSEKQTTMRIDRSQDPSCCILCPMNSMFCWSLQR